MRFHRLVAPALLLAIPAISASAQVARVYSGPSGRLLQSSDDDPRAALGLSIGGSGSSRDTLGLLVTAVTPNGPAERAGIQEGDRIASINGINLRVSPGDAGDVDAGNTMSRRLTRELGRVRAGDEVELRVYADGRARTIRVRTADSDSLYSRRRVTRSDSDERATLGMGLASTGSRRDTLGVLVMFVDDNGPAARAGIEEGNRIAAVNDIDLRAAREDAGDDFVGTSKVRRLQREISTLHAGDNVDLRVYANGEYRTVRLRAARASDFPHRGRTFIITGEGPGFGAGALPFGMDGALMGDQVRRAIERAMESSGRALEGLGRGLNRMQLRDNDFDLPDIDAAPAPPRRPRARPMEPLEPMQIEPLEPIHIEPLEPSRLRRVAPSKVPYATAVLDDPDIAVPKVAAATLADGMLPRKAPSAALDISGLRLVAVGSELASYLGKGSERGLLVVDVPTWARRTLRSGDVVLSVDGRPVRSDDGEDNITIALPRYREAQLDILRDGVHHSVTLPARR